MKSGNILVISIGGNITQVLEKNDTPEPILKPATEEDIRRVILGDNIQTSSLTLHDGNVLKNPPIRITVERLGDNNNLEQQDSSQVDPSIWTKIVTIIKEREKYYEGVVVLHGLDTLAYTASAVSFMIRNQNLPIVFTGSQRPLNYKRSDALQNIITAITLAASRSLEQFVINEVTIYLHDTLFRANRASMSSASSYRSFDSLNFPPLAHIGEHIDIKNHLLNQKKIVGNISFSLNTNANVQIVDVFPGMSPSVIEGLIGDDLDLIFLESFKNQVYKLLKDRKGEVPENTDEIKYINEIEDILKSNKQLYRLCKLLPETKQKYATEVLKKLESELLYDDKQLKGVILRTYGMGTAPTSPDVLKAIKRLVDKGVIVLNVTQAHSSRVSFNSDPVSLRLLEHGVISGLDMTSEAAFAKMVVILSDKDNWKKGKEYCEQELQLDLAGEQSHSIINIHFNKGEIKENSESDELFSKLIPIEENRDMLPNNIVNIQLRILGLKKINKQGGKTVKIRMIKCDDENQDISDGNEILGKDIIIEKKKNENNELKTINVSYDISDKEPFLFSKNSIYYLISDQLIIWSRISIVCYC